MRMKNILSCLLVSFSWFLCKVPHVHFECCHLLTSQKDKQNSCFLLSPLFKLFSPTTLPKISKVKFVYLDSLVVVLVVIVVVLVVCGGGC